MKQESERTNERTPTNHLFYDVTFKFEMFRNRTAIHLIFQQQTTNREMDNITTTAPTKTSSSSAAATAETV